MRQAFLALVLIVLRYQLQVVRIQLKRSTVLTRLAWLNTDDSRGHRVRSLIAGGAFDTSGVLLPLAMWLLLALVGLVSVVLRPGIAHRPVR